MKNFASRIFGAIDAMDRRVDARMAASAARATEEMAERKARRIVTPKPVAELCEEPPEPRPVVIETDGSIETAPMADVIPIAPYLPRPGTQRAFKRPELKVALARGNKVR